MSSCARVMAAIRRQPVDRVPISYFFGWNAPNRDGLMQKYGDVDAALEALRIDTRTAALATLIRPPMDRRCETVKEALALPWIDDPDNADRYEMTRAAFHARMAGTKIAKDATFAYGLREAIDKFKGRYAVFVHVWGVTEICQGYFGIQGLLENIAADPGGMKELFMRVGDFSARCAERALEYGPDVVQVSDDWGMNERLLFRPEFWWEAVHPATKLIVDAIKLRGVPVILHSDGHVLDVLDGIVDLGFDMMHPVQSSAGMDQQDVKRRFGGSLGIYGGLDITYTLPFGTLQEIDAEVRQVMRTLGKGSGYIFAPAHMVPPDVPLERTEYFYEKAYEHSWQTELRGVRGPQNGKE